MSNNIITLIIQEGSIKNNYISIRGHKDFFPKDSIGGKNRSMSGTKLSFDYGVGSIQKSDIDGSKSIIRRRYSHFYKHFNVKAGDTIIIERIGEKTYKIRTK